MATATAPDLDTLLPALSTGKSALIAADALGGLWGVPDDEALDLASELVTLGLLVEWCDGPAVPVVLLSSLAAERLGLVLEPDDTDDLERCRWVPAGSSRPPDRPRRKGGCETLECDLFKADADGAARGLDSLPDPRASRQGLTLLGLQRPWPLAQVPDRPCPGCGGLTPSGAFYCLWCARSSKDGRIGVVRPLPRDKGPSDPKAPRTKRSTGLAGGMGEPAEGRAVAVEGRKSPARKAKRAGRKWRAG
jgi:hypothetical protein